MNLSPKVDCPDAVVSPEEHRGAPRNRWPWGLRLVIFVAHLAVPLAVGAPPISPKGGPVPLADEIDPEALKEAAQASLAHGVRYLLNRIASNQTGWAVEPWREREVKVITNRFVEKEVEVPVWRYETFETVVFEEGRSGLEAGRLKKVTGQRPIEKVGTRREVRRIHDPNGPIVIVATNVEDTVWQVGFLAQNAMALYALVKAGVPESDPRVRALATALDNAVLAYGIPDTTLDVAWLVAAFSNLAAPDFHPVRDRCIRKLLEGQITEESARGCWGPVCINAKLLSALITYEQTLGKELARRRERAKRAPDSRQLAKAVEEVENAVTRLQDIYPEVAQQGLRFDAVLQGFRVAPLSPTYGCEFPVVIRGLPYYIYNQTLADLESTSLALFALREAAAHGALPPKTSPPVVPGEKALWPSQDTEAILARAAAALCRLQKPDGSWDEAHIHQSLETYRELGVTQSFLARSQKIYDLVSGTNLLSTVLGYAALTDIARIVGQPRLMDRYGRHVLAARAAAERAVEVWLEGWTNATPVGGHVEPYDLCFRSEALHRSPLPGGPSREDLRLRMMYRVVVLQNDDGSWGLRGRVPMQSSGVRALREAIGRAQHEERQAGPAEKTVRRAFDPATYWAERPWDPPETARRSDLATPWAVCALASAETAVWPPSRSDLEAWRDEAMRRLTRSARQLKTSLPVETMAPRSASGDAKAKTTEPHAAEAEEAEPLRGLPLPPAAPEPPRTEDEVL